MKERKKKRNEFVKLKRVFIYVSKVFFFLEKIKCFFFVLVNVFTFEVVLCWCFCVGINCFKVVTSSSIQPKTNLVLLY